MSAAVDPIDDSGGTRLVLVDTHPERRTIMRNVFEHSNVEVIVVGEAGTQAGATGLVDQHGADLVIIDLSAPVTDGMETIAALRGRFLDLAIVVCWFNNEPASRQQALQRGADAYLLKPVSARQVLAAMPDRARHEDPMRSSVTVH